AVKSFALVPPAPWAPVTMSCRSSSTPTAIGDTPAGTAPLAVMVPTGRSTHCSCSKAGGGPERIVCFPAVVDGNSDAGKPFRLAFHDLAESELPVGAALNASLGPSPGM